MVTPKRKIRQPCTRAVECSCYLQVIELFLIIFVWAPNSFDSTNATNVKTAQKKHGALSNILLTFHKYTPDKYWEYLDQVFSVQ